MQQQKRICIVTGSHLCHNPRVMKEACTLGDAGFDVKVMGAWSLPDLKRKDQMLASGAGFDFEPVVDFTLGFSPSRAKAKLGRLIHRWTGRENSWQLGPSAALLRKGVINSNANLIIAHSEQAIWAVTQLQKWKVRGRRSTASNPLFGVDFEDWYSEDLLPEARKSRPIKLLRSLEQAALSGATYATCSSRAMAGALAREYGCKPPTVIYNAFPWSDREKMDRRTKDRRNRDLPSIHWYSQTLGPGRGLEELIAAVPLLEHDVEIHLRGAPTTGFLGGLRSKLGDKWRDRIFVHDPVSNEELLSRIAEHDIGFAGEQKYCKSRDLTVTNKILHYLLAGLAVVASDTAGQREVADQAKGAAFLYRANDPKDLACQLNQVLSSAERLDAAKQAALAAAKGTFCWEKQAPVLLSAIQEAIAV